MRQQSTPAASAPSTTLATGCWLRVWPCCSLAGVRRQELDEELRLSSEATVLGKLLAQELSGTQVTHKRAKVWSHFRIILSNSSAHVLMNCICCQARCTYCKQNYVSMRRSRYQNKTKQSPTRVIEATTHANVSSLCNSARPLCFPAMYSQQPYSHW